MRKMFAAAGVAAAIAGGSVAGLAVANSGNSSTANQAQDAVLIQDGSPEREVRDGNPRGRALDAASEIVGVDADTLREALRGGQTLAEVAEENGVSRDALVSALTERANEHLAEAVRGKHLTQEQADEKQASLGERIEARVDGEAPAFQHGERRGEALQTAARVIGVEETSMVADLRAGQSLAEIAQDNSVDPQTVIDAITEDKEERIQQAVEDGRLTQEEANEKLGNVNDRVEARVNGAQPVGPRA